MYEIFKENKVGKCIALILIGVWGVHGACSTTSDPVSSIPPDMVKNPKVLKNNNAVIIYVQILLIFFTSKSWYLPLNLGK